MAKSISVDYPHNLKADRRNNPLLEWVFEHIEEHPEPKVWVRRGSYQSLLRALGAWLDAKDACNVNLIETPAGFVMRYGVGEETLLLRKFILTYGELEHLEVSMKERRFPRPSGRYQDFLRALGYEIDQQGGSYLVLDEIEEHLYLTFFRECEGAALTSTKCARLVNPDDRAVILRKAYARRTQPEAPKRFWQRLRGRQRSLAQATGGA